MKKRLYWIVAALVLLGVGVGYWRYRGKNRKHLSYKTAAVEKKHIVAKVTASGTLSALVTVQVGTQVSGRVQKLFVDFNSPVTKGQQVAKIDPQLFEAQLRQSQANYMSAKAGVETAKANSINAEKQYARSKALRDQNLASQADLETAEAALSVAHANVDAAKASLAQAAAQLNQAQVNLSYTSIVSPIDGTVISRSVDTGQTVAASLSTPTLFTIAQDLTKMQVDTNIAEGDVGRLQVGMKTYFTVDSYPGENFVGKIRQIRNAPTTLQNVVTYDAVIDVNNADLRLRPGMTANVTVIYDEKQEALAVPNTALRFRPPPQLLASITREGRRHPKEGGDAGDAPAVAATAAPDGKTIWVMHRGAPQEVSVHLGLSDGTVTEVLDDELQEGELVVIDTLDPEATPSASGTATSLRRLF